MTSTDRQRGASLIEFVFVLPVFLLLIFGLVVYSIAFVTQQTVNHAAQQAAEAVVRVDTDLSTADYRTLALETAQARLEDALSIFPGEAPTLVAVMGRCTTGGGGAARLCIESEGASAGGRRTVSVDLAPEFSTLWPGFPVPALLPGIGVISATGTVTVSG